MLLSIKVINRYIIVIIICFISFRIIGHWTNLSYRILLDKIHLKASLLTIKKLWKKWRRRSQYQTIMRRQIIRIKVLWRWVWEELVEQKFKRITVSSFITANIRKSEVQQAVIDLIATHRSFWRRSKARFLEGRKQKELLIR